MKRVILAFGLMILSTLSFAKKENHPIQHIGTARCFQDNSEVGYEIRLYKNQENFAFAQVVLAGKGFYGEQVATMFYSSTIENGTVLFTTRQKYDPEQSNAMTFGFIEKPGFFMMMKLETKNGIPSEPSYYKCTEY